MSDDHEAKHLAASLEPNAADNRSGGDTEVTITYTIKRYPPAPAGGAAPPPDYLWVSDGFWSMFTPTLRASQRLATREEASELRKRMLATEAVSADARLVRVKVTAKKRRCGLKGHADLTCDCWNHGYAEGLQAGRIRERDSITLWLERKAPKGVDSQISVRLASKLLRQNDHRTDRRGND